VADKSAVTVTAPEVGEVGVKFINVPLVVVTVCVILAGISELNAYLPSKS